MTDAETSETEGPCCPACGHTHRDAWEWGLEDGDHTDHECEECGALMRVEYSVIAIWTATMAQQGESDE